MEIELNNDSDIDLRLKHPFNCIISGGTGSGKTTLLSKILINGDLVTSIDFDRIVYCYGEYLPDTFNYLKSFKNLNIEFVEGLPNDDKIQPFDTNINNCLILDDLMQECVDNQSICNYFTRTARHRNISVFFLTQNFYQKGKYSTTIVRNASYIILFSSPNDFQQIKVFASQRFNSQAILDAYKSITKMPHGYLLIDSTQNTDNMMRLRTNIIPPDDLLIFVPKNR
jgi:Poxvirus A32 protein